MANSSGVDAGALPATRALEVEERSNREQAERWAVAIASGVASKAAAPFEADVATEDWRPSDSAMTPTARSGAGSSAGSVASSDAKRMTLDVDGGDLGTLKVVIDRDDDGLRVVLGVENSRAEAAALPERATLLRALSAAGLRVASFDVVPSRNVGTVLAGYKRVHHAADQEPTPEPNDKARRHARGRGRLSFIG
jgi:hypothetical protein